MKVDHSEKTKVELMASLLVEKRVVRLVSLMAVKTDTQTAKKKVDSKASLLELLTVVRLVKMKVVHLVSWMVVKKVVLKDMN